MNAVLGGGLVIRMNSACYSDSRYWQAAFAGFCRCAKPLHEANQCYSTGASYRWSLVTIYPKPRAVALGWSPVLGGHLVRSEWLGQNVQCAVATTSCATGMQCCDCFADHYSSGVRHSFPIGFREFRS